MPEREVKIIVSMRLYPYESEQLATVVFDNTEEGEDITAVYLPEHINENQREELEEQAKEEFYRVIENEKNKIMEQELAEYKKQKPFGIGDPNCNHEFLSQCCGRSSSLPEMMLCPACRDHCIFVCECGEHYK